MTEWQREHKPSGDTLFSRKYPEGVDLYGFKISELTVGVKEDRVFAIALERSKVQIPGFTDLTIFFFKDDKPGAYRDTFSYSPRWPTNTPALIEEGSCFERDLGILRMNEPSIAESLEKCVRHLGTQGPTYRPGQTYTEFTLE